MSCIKVLVYTFAITMWMKAAVTSSSIIQPTPTAQVPGSNATASTEGTISVPKPSATAAGIKSIGLGVTSRSNSASMNSYGSPAVSNTLMSQSATLLLTTTNNTGNSSTSSLSPSANNSGASVTNDSGMNSFGSQAVSYSRMTQSATFSLKTSNTTGNSSTATHSSVYYKHSSQRVSPISPSFTMFINKTEFASSVAALATSFQTHSVSMLSASGQSSKTSNVSSSGVLMHSVDVNQTSQVDSSNTAQSSLKRMVSMTTQHIASSQKVLSSVAALATSFQTHSVSMLSASGQSSKTSNVSSSGVLMHSVDVNQTSQVESSKTAQSSLKRVVSMTTQHIASSQTVLSDNISPTTSPRVNATPSSPRTTPSTSAVEPRPTLPPQGTKFVNMEVSFDIPFKEEYNNPDSEEYKTLEKNLTETLENVYKNVEGFVAVRIILIKEGSVVCSYIVILAKDSQVEESKLKEILQEASKDGKLGYTVKRIEVTEEETAKTEEKLPKWALVTMILLGCLSFVSLLTVIYVCVKHRRSILGDGDTYFISSGEVGLVHSYDTVSMGENNKKSAVERRVVGSHTNPTYGANGALAD